MTSAVNNTKQFPFFSLSHMPSIAYLEYFDNSFDRKCYCVRGGGGGGDAVLWLLYVLWFLCKKSLVKSESEQFQSQFFHCGGLQLYTTP